jgi:G3E family GTPase
MSFSERIRYASFVHNRQTIESRWDKRFGDRQNELVFIGQDLNQELIESELESCLCTEAEIKQMESKGKFKDPFPLFS